MARPLPLRDNAAAWQSKADLATRREEASKRKMIMLGHMPPDDEVQLF